MQFFAFSICSFTVVYWLPVKTGLRERNRSWKEFWGTYRSGTRLPGCFFDHTEERRAGRAPPLYHPHKDRKRARRYLKGHPTHRLKITSKVIWLQHSPPEALRLFKERPNKSSCVSKEAQQTLKNHWREISHILFSKRTRLPNTSVLFPPQVQAVKTEDGGWQRAHQSTQSTNPAISANSVIGIWQSSGSTCLKIRV